MRFLAICLSCFGFGVGSQAFISDKAPLWFRVCTASVGVAFIVAALIIKHRFSSPVPRNEDIDKRNDP